MPTAISSPTIQKATILTFDKDKLIYTLRVDTNRKKSYMVTKKDKDFIQLSQKLHEHLPTKIKNYNQYRFLLNNKQQQRLQELNQFLNALLINPYVSESSVLLDFFNITEEQQPEQQQQENTSRWKRLRCSSFLAHNNQNNSNGLSFLQAANKIIPPSWHRNSSNINVKPSISTPIIRHQRHKPSYHSNIELPLSSNTLHARPITDKKQMLKKSKSSMSMYNSSTIHPLNSKKPPLPLQTITNNEHNHNIKPTIKIKVIYDMDHIIVIQVPRTISFSDLKYKIAQKFSDDSIKHHSEMIFLFQDNSSSCCSIAHNPSDELLLPATVIKKEQDLVALMHTKWNRLEKVTLRCIV